MKKQKMWVHSSKNTAIIKGIPLTLPKNWYTLFLMKKYDIKRSSAGLGLFAAKPYKRGELIIEYLGEYITEEEVQRRGGKYIFELSDTHALDGKDRSNIARYINHSCAPNAYPEVNNKETRVFIYAKRGIKPGEEITYNYGKEYFNDIIKPLGCRCSKCSTKTATR